MGKMIRKQIYIEAEQNTRLKSAAKSRGISQAKLIRLALNSYIDPDAVNSSASPNNDWQEVMRKTREGHYAEVFEASFSGDEPIWDRENLYAERISRLG